MKFLCRVRPHCRALCLALCLAPLVLSGCFMHRHTVGDGPRGGEVRTHTTWYVGWGFFPINGIDPRQVVGGSDHYRTSFGMRPFDVFINIFTGPLGFFRTTLRVEK